MNITDELRDCIRTANRGYEDVRNPYNDREILHIPEEELLKIADRIDAEHESACAEAYGNGVMSVPIALDESAWVKLPVDADGEPIHVGDVMENTIHQPTHREVTGVGAECFYAWEDRCGRYSQFSANCYRHYHAPTVEDVLREFADEVQRCCDTADTIAEYAAKLTLRGDE